MRVQHPTTKCRRCEAEIGFCETRNGKLMPVDAESLTDEDIEIMGRVVERVDYRYGEHVSHFDTCKKGD